MASSPSEPALIPGGLAVDDRGQLSFVNDFDFSGVRRFYMVENFSTDVVRAFHGHRREHKFVFVAAGSAIVAAVEMDDPVSPSKSNKVHRFVLSSRTPRILRIPAGYANGFRPLEAATKLIFFTNATLEQSQADDFRFPADYWGAEVWNVEHR